MARVSSSDSELDVICKLSRFYGSDPSIVLAGGGNTSCKVGNRLYVKASGTSLATMMPEGFVVMDRDQLEDLAGDTLDADPHAAKRSSKTAFAAARCEPERGQRPSVEVLLHHLLPGTYVVHSHATIANTLTCRADGRQLAEEIFGNSHHLAAVCRSRLHPRAIAQAGARRSPVPSRQRGAKAILMANHGLIVAGDDPAAIRSTTNEVLEKIAARLGDDWLHRSFGQPQLIDSTDERVRQVGPALRGLLADRLDILKIVTFDESPVAQGLVGTAVGKQSATTGPLTPDQIVYCGSFPLWFEPKEGEDEAALVARLRIDYRRTSRPHSFRTKDRPRCRASACLPSATTIKQANTAREVYLDAVKVMAGATRLGGISYLTDRERLFIEDWEVESYRRGVSLARPRRRPASQRQSRHRHGRRPRVSASRSPADSPRKGPTSCWPTSTKPALPLPPTNFRPTHGAGPGSASP